MEGGFGELVTQDDFKSFSSKSGVWVSSGKIPIEIVWAVLS
jgi:hypothetical protein